MNRILYTTFVLSAILSACSKETDTSYDAQTKTLSFSPRIESAVAAPQSFYIYVFKNLDVFSNLYSGPLSGVSIPLYYHINYLLTLTTAPASKVGASVSDSYYVQLQNSTDASRPYNNVAPYVQSANTNLFYQSYTINNVSPSSPSVVNNIVLGRIEAKATLKFTPLTNKTKAYLRAMYTYGTFTLNNTWGGSLKTTIGDEVTLVASATNEVSVRFFPYNDPTGTPENMATSRSFMLHLYDKQLNQWTAYPLKLADGVPLSVGNNYVFSQSGTQLIFEPTLVENWGAESVLGSD